MPSSMSDIDFNFEYKGEPQKGSILLSEPFLMDDYFQRSVVFLCDHNEDGSFGFVINKFIDTNVSELINNFPEVNARVSIGGPVDNSNLFYVHCFGKIIPDSIPIANGLSLGGSFATLIDLLKNDPSKIEQIRFFIGYSGWSEGQLEEELTSKSWIVLNKVPKSLIMNTEINDIWKEVMEKLGGKFKIMAHFPKNPADN